MASPAPTAATASAPPSRPKVRVWLTITLAGAVAAVGLFGLLAERDFRTRTRASTRELLQSVTTGHADGLALMMAEIMSDTRAFGSRDAVQNALNPALPRLVQSSERSRMQRMLKYTASLYDYQNLMVLDSALRPIGYFAHDDHLVPTVHRAFQRAVRERRPVPIPIHRDESGIWEFGAVAPAFIDNDSTQPLRGLVYGTFGLTHGLLPGLRRLGGVDAAIESTVLQVDGDSVVVIWSDSTQFGPVVRLTRLSRADTQYFAVQAMQTRTNRVLRGLDYRGVDVLAHVAPIPGTPWVATSKIKYADAESRIRLVRVLGVVMFLMLGALVGIFGRALFLDRLREYDLLRLRSGEQAARVLHSSLDGYVALDDTGRIVEVNAALCAMTGYSAEELAVRRLHDVKVTDRPADIDATLAHIREAPEGLHYTSVWRRKDGSTITIAVSARYLNDPSGGRIVGFVRDITDDLAREQRLVRLNQLYVLLNRVTEALFTSRTPAEAHQATCRLTVESSDFKLAWIGGVHEADRTVRPLAMYGDAARDLHDIALGLDEGTANSIGPTSRCFRSGKPEIENDLLGSAEMAPWHDIARRYGARSAGSFPVIVDDRTVGVLTLCHAQVGYFQPDEVAILHAVGRFLGSVLQSLAAQETQRTEQERFRLLFDSSLLPMLVTDLATGRTLRMNPAFTTTFGWTFAELPDTDSRVRLLYPDPAYRSEAEAEFARAIAALEAGAHSHTSPVVHVRCKDGQVKQVRRFITKVRDELLLGWVDLTELRRSQALLSESQEIARLLSWEYHFADDSIHFADAALQARVRSAGIGGMEWITNAMVEEDRAMAHAAIAKALRERSSSDFTARQLSDDGSIVYRRIRVRFEYDAAGLPVRAVGSSQDVTAETLTANELENHRHNLENLVAERTAALKAAYDEVAASDRRFAFAMEASAEGIWDWDVTTSRVTYSNEYCKILGYEPGGMPTAADDWSQRVHPDDRKRVVRDLYRLFEHDEARALEFRIRRRDGSFIWAEATGKVMSRDAAGQAMRVVGTLTDLSERRAIEDALRAAKEAADEANSAKSSFLAVMSHEIRTPLNGVIGMAEVLEQSALPAREADAVRVIHSSAANLLGLIDDILDFSKIEAGRLELEHADVDLEEIVDAVVSSLGSVALGRQVEVSTFIDPALPRRIVSDSTRLRQIMYNLLGNAIKFSGGRDDRVGRVAMRLVYLAGPPAQLRITVADNGIGISEESRARLFQSFMQAESSTTRRYGGTGLGLAICKRLSQLFGGDIEVDSSEGVGTTFTVTIPVRPSAVQPIRTLPDVAGLHCVVVRTPDDFGEANDLTAYLQHGGAVVSHASSGAEAVRIAALLPELAVVVEAARLDEAPGGPADLSADVRHLHITRGMQRVARVITPNFVALDRFGVREHSLRRAVAVAAGRASPETSPDAERPPSISPAEPRRTVAEARREGRLILVAEDDETNQKVILRQLEMLGYAAEVASNGAEALALWRAGGFAAVLSDLHMPVMDGYALTEAIRREERPGAHLPILALTANALRGEEIRAKALGMDAYLTKPIRLVDLQAALAQWMVEGAGPGPAVTRRVGEDEQKVAGAPALPARIMDVAVLKRLVGDDPVVLHELLQEFRSSARRALAELRTAHAAYDVSIVAAIAHRLKSSARTVGALTLGEHCAELESAAKRRDDRALERGLQEVEGELVAVDGELAALLNE
jgi:PAS domain S-box-containing protein